MHKYICIKKIYLVFHYFVSVVNNFLLRTKWSCRSSQLSNVPDYRCRWQTVWGRKGRTKRGQREAVIMLLGTPRRSSLALNKHRHILITFSCETANPDAKGAIKGSTYLEPQLDPPVFRHSDDWGSPPPRRPRSHTTCWSRNWQLGWLLRNDKRWRGNHCTTQNSCKYWFI